MEYILEKYGYKLFGDGAYYKLIGFSVILLQVDENEVHLAFLFLGANNKPQIWNKESFNKEFLEKYTLEFESRLSKHSILRTDFDNYKKWIKSFKFDICENLND